MTSLDCWAKEFEKSACNNRPGSDVYGVPMETMFVPSDYQPPVLTELGTFEDLTKATNVGTFTDVVLPHQGEIGGHVYS
jgi:hypothetical protein